MPSNQPQQDSSLPSWRILIVEDEVLVSMFLDDVLTDLGHTVAGTAESMADALSLAASREVDLAMVDLGLAGVGDGIQTASALLARHGIRTILMSGASHAAVNEHAKDLQALGVLVKPYTEAEVRDALQVAARELRPAAR